MASVEQGPSVAVQDCPRWTVARVKEFWNVSVRQAVYVLAALGVCLLWAWWPALGTMAERWSSDPQYSHGFLVPLFALVILWCRSDRFPRDAVAPSWWGLPWVLMAAIMYVWGGRLVIEPIEAFSLLP